MNEVSKELYERKGGGNSYRTKKGNSYALSYSPKQQMELNSRKLKDKKTLAGYGTGIGAGAAGVVAGSIGMAAKSPKTAMRGAKASMALGGASLAGLGYGLHREGKVQRQFNREQGFSPLLGKHVPKQTVKKAYNERRSEVLRGAGSGAKSGAGWGAAIGGATGALQTGASMARLTQISGGSPRAMAVRGLAGAGAGAALGGVQGGVIGGGVGGGIGAYRSNKKSKSPSRQSVGVGKSYNEGNDMSYSAWGIETSYGDVEKAWNPVKAFQTATNTGGRFAADTLGNTSRAGARAVRRGKVRGARAITDGSVGSAMQSAGYSNIPKAPLGARARVRAGQAGNAARRTAGNRGVQIGAAGVGGVGAGAAGAYGYDKYKNR